MPAGPGPPEVRLDGARLRRLREEAGLTLTGLANAASVSKAHLSYIENGQREASPPVAARLAQALGVALVDLRSAEPGA